MNSLIKFNMIAEAPKLKNNLTVFISDLTTKAYINKLLNKWYYRK